MNPPTFRDPQACIDEVLTRVGRRIVLATPLGVGKPEVLLNALYRRAKRDPSLELEIITALSLNPPRGASELEERFYAPLRRRIWSDIPRLDFADDNDAKKLPGNVRICEFYARPGSILGNLPAQQNHISSNYTHVARDLLRRGVNVLMQAVAVREQGPERRYSYSTNPDVTVDLLQRLEADGRSYLGVAQVNRALPFFGHACEAQPRHAHLLLDDPALDHAPFALPHEPVDRIAHAIGLRGAALVRDGGTLQVGIGALGDAVCHALRLRDRTDGILARALGALGHDLHIDEIGGRAPFEAGLYVASEMISYPLFVLFEQGIVRRRVYDDERRTGTVDQHAPSEAARATVLQGAFLLGPAEFYRKLQALPEAQRELIDMNSVAEVNRVYTQFQRENQQRRHARLLNMTLKVTLLGAAASDQLEDGRVLSGVGGQGDFVNMAHQLPDARSALLLRATSSRKGATESNLVFRYGHATIPRHMRDLVVTEYGVADLRSKTDSECIMELLAIADTRFQDALLAEAKRAGKVPASARIPDAHRENVPARIERALAPLAAELPALPFGSDISPEEWALAGRLKKLESALGDTAGRARLAQALASPASADQPDVRFALRHLALSEPSSLKERALARLVRAAHRL